MRRCLKQRYWPLELSLLEVIKSFVDLLLYIKPVASRIPFTRGLMFPIPIFVLQGAAKNRSTISAIANDFVDREGTSTFEWNMAIETVDTTHVVSWEVWVSVPILRMWTTFPD